MKGEPSTKYTEALTSGYHGHHSVLSPESSRQGWYCPIHKRNYDSKGLECRLSASLICGHNRGTLLYKTVSAIWSSFGHLHPAHIFRLALLSAYPEES